MVPRWRYFYHYDNNGSVKEVVFQILLSLKEEAQDAEGILAHIHRVSGASAEPAIASFYRALKKGSDAGYLLIEEPDASERLGRPRQRYRITRAGRSALRAEARRLERLAELALSDSASR